MSHSALRSNCQGLIKIEREKKELVSTTRSLFMTIIVYNFWLAKKDGKDKNSRFHTGAKN